MLRNAKEHEIIIVIYSYLEESYDQILSLYAEFIESDKLKVCHVGKDIFEANTSNVWTRTASEVLRENYIYNLQPDFLLITSFFEGHGEDFVCSINKYYKVPTGLIFYDLIPLMNQEKYLADPGVYQWYMNKIEQLDNAHILLSISESARQEALEYLNLDEDKLMYSGATDERKNHLRLIEAFSMLPKNVLDDYQLVFVGGMPEEHFKMFKNHAKNFNLDETNFVMTGKVSDEEMNALYNLCSAFIFPSWHEGFGLPALEAMQCEKAVIASNTSSLPEVIGREDAMFDPFNVESIKNKIYEVLTNVDFRKSLEKHAVKQAQKFSWDITSKKAIKKNK